MWSGAIIPRFNVCVRAAETAGDGASSGSPLAVIREDVVSGFRDRVACEPALGVLPLRGHVSQGAGPERIGGGIILEYGPASAAAVREPLAVLHHEVDIMLGPWHGRQGVDFHPFRGPMDLRHFGAAREGVAVGGSAGRVSVIIRSRRKAVSVIVSSRVSGSISGVGQQSSPPPGKYRNRGYANLTNPRRPTDHGAGIYSALYL